MQARDARTSVVVFDATGSIYEALRDADARLRVERSEHRGGRGVSGAVDIAVVAAYERVW